jgi:hypothetical protein
VKAHRDAVAVRFLSALPKGSVCAVTGAPGTGKTRAVQVADACGAFRRRIVFDPYGFRDRLEHKRGKHDLHPWPGEIGTAPDLVAMVEETEPGRSIIDRDPLRLVVSSRDLRPEKLGKAFAAVADLAWNTGDVDLICEEAGLYSRQATDLIMRCASGGRHAGMRLLFIVQSLGRLQKDGRRHLTHGVFHACAEPDDLTDVRARCGPDFAAALSRLTPGESPLTWQLGQAFNQEKHQ